jgi:hypothetical protein
MAYDAANSGNLLPTFRDNLSVPSSGNYNANVYSAKVRCSVYNIDYLTMSNNLYTIYCNCFVHFVLM